MSLSEREQFLLNLYRNSELHGALLMGRIARSVSNPDVLLGATRHCAIEAQHAALLTELITNLGGTLEPSGETIQKHYSEDGGIPKDLIDLLVLSEVLEARVLNSYRKHLQHPNVHPKIRGVLEHIVEEEESHSGDHGWAERWLSTVAVERVQSARKKWFDIDARVAATLHAHVARLADERRAT